MNNQIFKNEKYLEVTYSDKIAPKTNYPHKLGKWLLNTFFKKPGTIVDLGCGRGEYLEVFDNLGFEASGVDLSPNIKKVKKYFSVQLADLEKDQNPFPNRKFDYVFSKSVVEHLHNPSNLADMAYSCLKPEGRAIIMTPSWEYTHWGPFYIDHTHVTPFTKHSLKSLLEISGFENVEVCYFYQLPFLWRWPFLTPLIRLFAKIPLPYAPFKESPWPNKLNKLIRFSKEVMLLAVCTKPKETQCLK